MPFLEQLEQPVLLPQCLEVFKVKYIIGYWDGEDSVGPGGMGSRPKPAGTSGGGSRHKGQEVEHGVFR